MKILVTGATGFIGSHLIHSLIQDDFEVFVIVRNTTDQSTLENCVCIVDSGDVKALHDQIKASGVVGCIHLASLFLGSHTLDDVNVLIQSNVEFPTRLAEAIQNTSVKWMINTGTFWQHYQDEAYLPVNLYAATKQAFADILKFYQETSDLSYVTLVLNDTFGPQDPRRKLIPVLLSASSENPIKLSPGEQILELTYIEDVVDAFMHMNSLLQHDPAAHNGKEYKVSSGDRRSLKEVVAITEKVLGRKIPCQWDALPYRKRELMVPWQGGTLLPNWTAKYNLELGLKTLIHAN